MGSPETQVLSLHYYPHAHHLHHLETGREQGGENNARLTIWPNQRSKVGVGKLLWHDFECPLRSLLYCRVVLGLENDQKEDAGSNTLALTALALSTCHTCLWHLLLIEFG